MLFEVSGEHPELPVAEIKALYEAYGKEFKVLDRDQRLLLVEKDLGEGILSRLALTHAFYPVERLTDLESLDRVLLSLGLKKSQTFRVRCRGFPDNSREERRAGEVIHEQLGLKADMSHPEVTLHLIKLDSKVVVSFKKVDIPGFNERDPNDRPFFHPLALNPKLARLFLNLARLRKGQRVLDPFCGSGSILIEAGLMGLRAIGTDKDREMLWGCAQNLEFCKVRAETGEGDATQIGLRDLDAVVTDPPYARASKVFDRDLKTLYDEFLESAYDSLKPGGYLVLAVPHNTRLGYAKAGFEKAGDWLHYVHRSLTRRVFVLRKPK